MLRQFRATLTTSSHFHPLHVENCDSNSRLVVDEDDNGKFRVEMVKESGKGLKKGFSRHLRYIKAVNGRRHCLT